jgi:hypothetical protein
MCAAAGSRASRDKEAFMSIERRDFLKASVAISMLSVVPRSSRAEVTFAPQPGTWRRFQLSTRIEIKEPEGASQAWVPVPSLTETAWFRSEPSEWSTNAAAVTVVQDGKYAAQILHAQWDGGQRVPTLEVVSTVTTQDRAINFRQAWWRHCVVRCRARALHREPLR